MHSTQDELFNKIISIFQYFGLCLFSTTVVCTKLNPYSDHIKQIQFHKTQDTGERLKKWKKQTTELHKSKKNAIIVQERIHTHTHTKNGVLLAHLFFFQVCEPLFLSATDVIRVSGLKGLSLYGSSSQTDVPALTASLPAPVALHTYNFLTHLSFKPNIYTFVEMVC